MRAYIVSYIEQGNTAMNTVIVRMRKPHILTGDVTERIRNIVHEQVGPCSVFSVTMTPHDVLTEPER